jgi:hypothetical protein
MVFEENSICVANNEEAVSLEIAATARSLKTNLILSFVFIAGFLFVANFSETLNVIALSTMKGMVPVLTTIANFGKIQNVMTQY